MKKLKKFIFKFSKKIIFKYLLTFSLIFTILFGSIVSCVSVSYGAEVLATGAKIVGYIGSTLGIVDKATGGGVTKMGGSTTSKIEQWWADNFNSGEIYENSSGEYVFSGTATQELYSALDSNSNTDCRVISNFTNQMGLSRKFHNYYTSSTINTGINTVIADYGFKEFLLLGGSVHQDENNVYSKIVVFDMADVGYIVVLNGSDIGFFNSQGQRISVRCGYSIQKYENGDYSGINSNIISDPATGTRIQKNSWPTNNNPYSNGVSWEYDSGFTPDLDYFYNNFPFNDNVFNRFYCNKSLIVAKSSNAGINFIENGSSRIINNYYTTLPSVSADTINNNDWDSIYNSYVNNVSNESNTYYNSETESYDDSALREAMKKYSDNIQSAILSGAEDIAQQVDYLNEWMSKIYTLLGQIADLIDQNESGGTSGATDLTTIEGKLTAIQNYLETISGDTLEIKNLVSNLENINNQLTAMQGDLDYLEDNYVILSNIYNYMISNPWGGGSHFKEPTDQPYDKWFKYLDDDDFPYGEILSKYNVLEQLLKGVAPFCFFAFASLVVNSLDVPAVEPVFDIPIQMDNALISVDENLTIDLTLFDSILPVTNALIIILWTMILLWSSFYLISHLLTILQL